MPSPESWLRVTLVLCAFGTLREIRPSEPYVSEFLTGPWRNITEEQLNRDVYPISTYSYFAQLVIIFLITDFLRFKPVIIVSGLCGIGIYAILLWTASVEWVQVSQFLYGTYIATEVAYYTYMYAKVNSTKYARVSSYTRIAALVGRAVSGVSGQLLTYFHLLDYRDLNYITLTTQFLATLWALWLPPVQYGIYFHQKNIDAPKTAKDTEQQTQPDKLPLGAGVRDAFTLIVRHARAAYRRPPVIVWSAIYAVALALFVQVQTYVQLLWRQKQNQDEDYVAYNGAVEAVQTLLGAGAAYSAALLPHAALPAPAAALQALALFLGTHLENVFVSYAGYIVVGLLYYFTITLASAKIAAQLCDDSCFGLIFGINTLIGTALQSILTSVMIQGIQLSIVGQYYTISCIYAVLALIWTVGFVTYKLKKKNHL